RPGLDRLRDRAALSAFSLILVTAPDRLARNYVHQVLLIEELNRRGCRVEFLDRPMSDDPHDQLVLQIRGAVAEYERSLIGERMRRGRLARLRAGLLLPWTAPLYGYQVDAERPRDPSRVRPDPVTSAVVRQIFSWYTESQPPLTLYQVTSRLTADRIPTPTGRAIWNVATVRGILRNPSYTGTAYSQRWQIFPAHGRRSARQPVGRGESHRPAPPEDWIGVSVPAIIAPETFAVAQARLEENKKMASRHNTTHQYLLRGLVSCGRCQRACFARCSHPGYGYYVCRDRSDARRAAPADRCQTRYAPAAALDELVWRDLSQLLTEPALITAALQRARAGEWLPQALQAQRENLTRALRHLERQQARLLDLYLSETIDRAEFERKRRELQQTRAGLSQQLTELEAQARQQLNLVGLAEGIEDFCRRLQPTLAQLTFAQRRQLVELLIDRVIVNDGRVEVRYVIPTGPAGEKVRFCHLRKDYFTAEAMAVFVRRPGRAPRLIADQIPERQLPIFIAGATHSEPEPTRRTFTVQHPSEGAMTCITRKPQGLEFDPRAPVTDFDAAL